MLSWDSCLLAVAMMHLSFASMGASPVETAISTSPHPIYLPSTARPYVEHATFLDAENYPETYSGAKYSNDPVGTYSGGFGSPQYVLKTVLQLVSKIGHFILNGLGLFVIGGIFTTIVCSLIPYCTISFHEWPAAETVRSLVTPDRISKAAAIVQDAVTKYDRLQRSISE